MKFFRNMYSKKRQALKTFVYNECSEVVSATLGTNEYTYSYDPIGNRTASTQNAEAKLYISNPLNQYIAIQQEEQTVAPTYDVNGNITEYVSANGNVVAQYQYSAFGEIISQSGESFTHRFSTKPYCSTIGLVEYQFRKYDPALGRWLSRDSIEEAGGINLYAFCGNNLCNNYDFNGFETYSSITFKRNHIQFFNAIMSELKTNYPQGDYYGHWWVEFGGESYGW